MTHQGPHRQVRPRAPRAVTFLVVLAAIVLLDLGPFAGLARAQMARVRVSVEGVDGELRENVLARLSIKRESDDYVREEEVRELDSRAPRDIKQALQPFGYYRPVITSELRREYGVWKAHYAIEPGPPVHIDSVDVSILGMGSTDPVFVHFREQFPLKAGDVLVQPRYDEAKVRLGKLALEHGYLDARFEKSEMRVDLEAYRASVTLHFNTGKRYDFGPVRFEQDVLNEELLRGFVTFKHGEPLDFNQLIELERALAGTSNFSRVTVRPRTDLAKGNQVPIIVELVPSRRLKYSLGGGYGSDSGANIRGDIEVRRLNRRGHRARCGALLSQREKNATAEYSFPWPRPRSDVLTASVSYQETETETSYEEKSVAGLSVARTPRRWQQVLSLTYQRQRYIVGEDVDLSYYLVPELAVSWVVVNDVVDPSRGSRIRLRTFGASDRLFSAASYLLMTGTFKRIRSPGKRNRILFRLEAGQNWTGDLRALPPSARFFAGGSQSVRGFGYNELGTRDEEGHVIGGEVLAVVSIEYEYRFLKRWGAAAFLDVGNAMHSFKGPYEAGTGVGARWLSPVGLVRVDLGVPVSKPDLHFHDMQLHLAIGPSL